MKQYTYIFVMVFSLIFLFFSCSFGKIPLTVRGYMTGQDSLGNKYRVVDVTGGGDGFDSDDDRATISFTPTKMELEITYIDLSDDYEIQGDELVSTGQTLDLEIGQTVDLAAADSFTPVFEEDIEIKAEKAGTYNYIEMIFGEYITISGELTVDGKTYTITDEQLPSIAVSVGLTEEASVTITEEGGQTVGIVLDISGGLLLQRIDDYDPEDPIIQESTILIEDLGGSSAVLMFFNQPVVLPHVGDGVPDVHIYKLTFDATIFEYPASDSDVWFKVLCSTNSSGDLMSAGWMPIYGSGGTPVGMGFSPGALYAPNIVDNGDDTYIIEDVGDYEYTDSVISFDSFELGEHTGTFIYGSTEVGYTATVIQ